MSTTTGAVPPSGALYGGLVENQQQKQFIEETQDRFLTLLVTQLRNQDPLDPMDNSQITTQLAQLSTVQGINQLNETLLAISGQMDVSQSMQAANLIGKEVLVPGDRVLLGSDPDNPEVKTATPFGIDLLSAAEKTEVRIFDKAGKLVRSLRLDDHLGMGIYNVHWDGRDDAGQPLPDGAYQLEVVATTSDEQRVSAEALTYGTVKNVAYSAGGLEIDLGLTGKYSLYDIRQIM
ncbi:MAG TPA: flagellar hook capping FlgD N-terminal domain-containing protein [Paenalcaligenes sp.]|nr:flagellar hook capping FlgD N-terminal domain-containing protein [Paenalcaligenes sp.]